jgi:hypothetical protein
MAVIAENNRQAALEKSFIQENSLKLKVQIDSIANYISEQSAFLFSLKNSISKQTKLHGQLMHKLSQLDPTIMAPPSTYELRLRAFLFCNKKLCGALDWGGSFFIFRSFYKFAPSHSCRYLNPVCLGNIPDCTQSLNPPSSGISLRATITQ